MKKYAFLLASFLLAACQTNPSTPFSVNDYAHVKKMSLNVNTLEITSHISTYHKLPHIEDKMPLIPAEALEKWAKNRFSAANPASPYTATVIIKEAYMTQTDKPGKNWYTLDNVSYKLTYNVELIFSRMGTPVNTQTVSGWEHSALPQKSALADKEKEWEKMMNAMVRKVNDQLVSTVPEQFR